MSTISVNLRELLPNDNLRIAVLLNNINVSKNLRDMIPYPYSVKDADEFIDISSSNTPQSNFAIEYNGELVGIGGLVLNRSNYSHSAELGYWLGEEYWDKGIMSKAVPQLVRYGFEELNLVRLYACVADCNTTSQRVLEKSGFSLECIAKKGVVKNGNILDEYRYALINTNCIL